MENNSLNEGKVKALERAIKQIERDFGAGAVMRLGDVGSNMNLEVISSGSLALDLALGIGGFPRGRVIEIYGPESSGKTTVALHAIAQAQKQGGIAAFIDAEHALDPIYARHLGVDTQNLLISQPDTGEQALEICEMLVRSGAIDIIVIDSVAALVPKAEIEGEMGDSHVGLQARLMSQALRKLTGIISKSKTIVIFINQLREKVGIMFGNPETTTGGRALKFYATIRIDIRKGETIKQGTDVIGNRTRAKIVKNKVAPPFRLAEFDMMYGSGISHEGTLIDIGVNMEIIQKSGSWYSYNGERMGQGKENVKEYLKQNPAIAQEIDKLIRDTLLAEPELFEEGELTEANDEEERAYDQALTYLSKRSYSALEIRRKLTAKGYTDEEKDAAMKRLQDNRFIDDEALANRAYRRFVEEGVYGNSYIAYKMKERGLEMPERLSAEEEKERALALVLVKLTKNGSVLRRKVGSYLANRGYGQSTFYAVLEELAARDLLLSERSKYD